MEQTNSDKDQELIEIRQNDVKKLWSQGLTFREIAIELNIGVATAWRDLDDIKKQARKGLTKSVEKELPGVFEFVKTGLKEIIKEQWKTHKNSYDAREQTAALALAKECYLDYWEVCANGDFLDRAIDVIRTHRKIKRRIVLEEEIEEVAETSA
jgi:DNA-binding Lrp family transcriptional regulator